VRLFEVCDKGSIGDKSPHKLRTGLDRLPPHRFNLKGGVAMQ
jgi:hypothetical protein